MISWCRRRPGRFVLLLAAALVVVLVFNVVLPPLSRSLPVAVWPRAATGREPHGVADRIGETDGTWTAPRLVWLNGTRTGAAVCAAFASRRTLDGCVDTREDLFAAMGPRGWTRGFFHRLRAPVLRAIGDRHVVARPCAWISHRRPVVFTWGHQSNLFHFVFLHLLPLWHIRGAAAGAGWPSVTQAFVLEARPRPPQMHVDLLRSIGFASVEMDTSTPTPWCFRDALVRNMNSWFLPSGIGVVRDWDAFRMPDRMGADKDFMRLALATQRFFASADAPAGAASAADAGAGARSTVVFIQRAPPRCLRHPEAVLERLGDRARVVRLRPEETTARAVAKTIRGANVIVGVHGAGLANMLFLREGGGVLELFPALFPEEGECGLPQCQLYNTMAGHLHLRYARVVGVNASAADASSEQELLRGKDLRGRAVNVRPEDVAAQMEVMLNDAWRRNTKHSS